MHNIDHLSHVINNIIPLIVSILTNSLTVERWGWCREFDWRIEIETFGFHEEGAIKRHWPGKIDEKRENRRNWEEREREGEFNDDIVGNISVLRLKVFTKSKVKRYLTRISTEIDIWIPWSFVTTSWISLWA